MASLAARTATAMAGGFAAAAVAPKGQSPPIRRATAVVIRAGTCDKTVKVRLGGEIWNRKVKKYFKKPAEHLVHDPHNSLRAGDVVEVQANWRTSKSKKWVVNKIVAPFGPSIHERPPVPTPEEREAAKAVKRDAKVQRRDLRRTRERLETRFEKSVKSLQKMLEGTRLEKFGSKDYQGEAKSNLNSQV